MKFKTPVLALLLSFAPLTLPLRSVHAADANSVAEQKKEYMQSLVVPLSATEANQLEVLLKAKQKADAEEKAYYDEIEAARKAADDTTRADHAVLQKKYEGLDALYERNITRWGDADEKLVKFRTDKRLRMPADIRPWLPNGATGLYLGRLPMGAQRQPLAVHLWTANRQTSPVPGGRYSESPFCIDIFKEDAPNKWVHVATKAYLGDVIPSTEDISLRYLRPATRQGLVVIQVAGVYMSTRYTVTTFPKDIVSDEEPTPSYTQDFYQGGVGGPKSTYDFGVDARGMTSVVNTFTLYGRNKKTTVFSWNGHEYAAPTAK